MLYVQTELSSDNGSKKPSGKVFTVNAIKNAIQDVNINGAAYGHLECPIADDIKNLHGTVRVRVMGPKIPLFEELNSTATDELTHAQAKHLVNMLKRKLHQTLDTQSVELKRINADLEAMKDHHKKRKLMLEEVLEGVLLKLRDEKSSFS